MPARFLDRHRLAVLLAVALLARAATFGNPIVHVDEDFYFAAARAMWDGAVPYVDVWDRKPAGLLLLYMLPAALPFGAGILAYQAMALASVVATAWIVARFADRIGWTRGATLTGIAYVLWLNVAGGQGGQSPVFYNLPMAAAALLVAGNDAGRFRRDAGAMALVGLALTIKTSAVFEGAFFGLWIVWRQWRASAPVVLRAAALAGIALAPTLAIAGWYAAHGFWADFLYANVESIAARAPDPPRERWGNLGKLILFLSPLVAMAGARVPEEARLRRFVRLWLAVAIGGVVVTGGWYEHYALPVLVPGTIAAAGFFGTRQRAAAAILTLVAVIGSVTVVANRLGRGGPGEFVALVRAIGHGPGCLWVYSGTTKLYPATGRCTLTRYLFPSHLYRTREAGAVGVDQAREVRRILARAPVVIVMRPPSIGERPEVRAIVAAAAARDYRLAASLPLGNETLSVFRRRDAPSPPAGRRNRP